MFTPRSAIRPFDVIISATIPHLLPPLTRSLRKTKSIGPDQYYAWWPPNPQQHPNISRDPRGDGFDVSLRPLGLPGDRSIKELIPDLPRNNGQRYLIFPEHKNPSQIYRFPFSIFCLYYICYCKVFSRYHRVVCLIDFLVHLYIKILGQRLYWKKDLEKWRTIHIIIIIARPSGIE